MHLNHLVMLLKCHFRFQFMVLGWRTRESARLTHAYVMLMWPPQSTRSIAMPQRTTIKQQQQQHTASEDSGFPFHTVNLSCQASELHSVLQEKRNPESLIRRHCRLIAYSLLSAVTLFRELYPRVGHLLPELCNLQRLNQNQFQIQLQLSFLSVICYPSISLYIVFKFLQH